MGIIKKFSILGWHFGGAEVKIDSKLTFNDVGNPLLDTSAGTMLWYLKTAVANAFRFRDNVKGQDIITVDTNADEIDLKYHTIVTNKVTQIDNTDSPYTAVWGQDIEVDCTGGNVVINLTTAVGNNGKTVAITRVDSSANTLTIDGATTETINGVLTKLISVQWDSLTLKSNGTNVTWR